MEQVIPPIKAEIDYLDENESEIYCVGDWISAKIDGKMVPAGVTFKNRKSLDIKHLRFFICHFDPHLPH